MTKAVVIFLGSYLIRIMNTYQPLHVVVVVGGGGGGGVGVGVGVVDHFYVALFSALEQIHCPRM